MRTHCNVFRNAVVSIGQTLVQVLQQQQPFGTPVQTAQAIEKQQLNARDFENTKVFTGGEDNWRNWL